MKSANFIFIILTILIYSGSYAYEISSETLLRNSSNGLMFGQEIITKWDIKDLDGKEKRTYLGIGMGAEINQVVYLDSQMKSGKYQDSIKFNLAEMDDKVPAYLFYSVLKLVLQNDSRGLVSKMSKEGVSLIHQEQLINKEKLSVMKQYKEKLKSEGFDEAKKSDEYKKLKQIYTTPYFYEDKAVVLKKDKNELNLVIEKNNWNLVFEYETRRFKKLIYRNLDKSITVEVSDYQLVDADHWIPGDIIFAIDNVRFHAKLLKAEIGKNKAQGILILKRGGFEPPRYIF